MSEFYEFINKLKTSPNEFQLRTVLEKYIYEKTGIEGQWESDRADLLYKGLIVETKRYGYLDNEKYLNDSIENRIFPYMKRLIINYGVLTDGKSIYFYEMDRDLNIKEVSTGYGKDFNEANLSFLIELIRNGKTYLSPVNLVISFGNPHKNKFIKEIIKKFYEFFKSTKDRSIKTVLLFNDWDKLFKITQEKGSKEEVSLRRKVLSDIFDKEVVDSNQESEFLFVMHNVLAIIVKLLIYNNFEKEGLVGRFNLTSFDNIPNLKKFMKKLENGDFFYKLGIYNLTVYDYFSWYTDDHISWDKNIHECIYDLIQEINKYIPLKNIDSPVDYVEDLYRNYIPKEIRHSFGEFFTPHLVAREVVREIAKILPSDKVIDPTCGSGTFLIEVLKVKKEAGLDVYEILKSISGVDLNPINVLLAKFNIVTNLLDKIASEKVSDLVIPIFIGDSSYIPSIKKIEDILVVKYRWVSFVDELQDFPEIIIPLDFMRGDKFFKVMKKVKDLIEEDIDNSKKDKNAYNFLIKEIESYEKEIGKKMLNKSIKEGIQKWISSIRTIHRNKLNSIWLFIFINYLYPFANVPYDKVIGNPPWVRWSNLPFYYKEKIKNTLRQKGLFSRDKNSGGVDLNIYALITFNALTHLLDKGGTLTFLLPKNSLQNKSLEGFRSLCMLKIGKIVPPIYVSKGKIFDEVDLEFIILTLEKVSMIDSSIDLLNSD